LARVVNGGSLCTDAEIRQRAGVPKPARNLREDAPTIYFNVPKGYEALIPHFRATRRCARHSFPD
jgi:feruloyl-CoA synthase